MRDMFSDTIADYMDLFDREKRDTFTFYLDEEAMVQINEQIKTEGD